MPQPLSAVVVVDDELVVSCEVVVTGVVDVVDIELVVN